MAKIQLNGRKISIKTKFLIYGLLKKYKMINKKIAVELNGTIISKSSFKKKYLKDKDKVEIVHFIGGG